MTGIIPLSHPPSETHQDDGNQRDLRLASLLAELSDRLNQGETIDIEEICSQHGDLSDELRRLWNTMLLAEVAGSDCEMSTSFSTSLAPLDMIELPCEIGDYQLLQELGRGGMGIVYRARQISLNREVAIKMILRGDFESLDNRQRFQIEAEAAARLNHPGIVPVYEVGQLEGRPYFNMKLVEGQTLSQRLADGPIPPREAAQILAAVSKAIHYAHRQGVLHRDLKPSNILLDENGDPHVMDFGLAKQLSGSSSLTQSGAVLGTPAYMAPEQAAGARGEVGPASDVYSLGVILYQMLTGRPPFQAASPLDTILMVLDQEPVPPRLLNPKADRDLEMIALRCLQKPPDLRYGTAQELADDLQAYLNDEPISARSGRFSQVLARLFRETHHAVVLENWGLLWMLHSVVLLLACLLTNIMHWSDVSNRWYYIILWTVGFWAWAGLFWTMRQRLGPVTFVERQIAHIWAGSMAAIALLFPVEYLLGLPVLALSPVLGLINGMVFLIKAGILTGTFYIQAAALFLTAIAMAVYPDVAHLIFGVVSAACFFVPGLKYYRRRLRTDKGKN